MKTISYFRKIFVRQEGQNDCGIACLAMIMNYTGKPNCAEEMNLRHSLAVDGLSLLDLRKLAENYQVMAQCVSMNIETLRANPTPAILHMKNQNNEDHFQVCFGSVQKKGVYYFLIADPAKDVLYLKEESISEMWQSKAALYFPELPHCPIENGSFFRVKILFRFIPPALLMVVPVLNLFSCLLGIAISWVLQSGMTNSFTDKRTALMASILILLFLINISRSVLSLARQKILMSVSRHINEYLSDRLIRHVLQQVPRQGARAAYPLKKAMTDIQRFQNAVFALVNIVMADGAIIVLIISGLLFSQLLIGLVNLTYVGLAIAVMFMKLQELDLEHSRLNELAAAAEKMLLKDAEHAGHTATIPTEQRTMMHRKYHDRYRSSARTMADKISRLNFVFECLGALCVVLALTISLIKFKHQQLLYGPLLAVVISSLFITTLVPKICNSLITIADGLSAANGNTLITRKN